MNEVALTTNGSRTFGGTITVTWSPSTTEPLLTVMIDSGGSLLKALNFDGTETQSFKVGQGTTVTTEGTFTAVFNAAGKTGTLTAEHFSWDISGQKGGFQGTIGIW